LFLSIPGRKLLRRPKKRAEAVETIKWNPPSSLWLNQSCPEVENGHSGYFNFFSLK